VGSAGWNHDPDASAVGATGSLNRLFDPGLGPGRLGCDSPGREPWAGPVAPMTVGRAEQAVISDVDASVRPDGLKKPTHTLFGREGPAWGLSSGRCLGLTRDVAILPLEDARMADGHSNDLRGKISEGVLAPADWLTGHDPGLCPDVLIDVSDQVGFLPWVADLGWEDSCAGRDVDEEVCA
jgi:hypothetical protein